MRILKWFLGLSLAFAAALAVAQARPVAASPSADLDLAAGSAAAVEPGGAVVDHGRGPGGGRRGPGGGGELAACATLARTVKQACPCNGPDGAGWASGHEGYVECVSQALDAALVGNEDPVAAECATKILERATASQIGEPGFVCPERKRCDVPEEPADPGAGGEGGATVDHGRRHPRPCPTAEPTAEPPTP